MVEHFDAIVIGSGFGGAVAAARLSQAGFSVLLLERGRRYEAGDFPALPDDDRLAPDLRRWLWSTEQGLWDVKDLGEIIAVQAAGYGGGSLIYANVHLRPPANTFDERWPEKFRGDALDRYFDLAAYMMNPAPIAESPAKSFKKTEILDRATTTLGREPFRPPLAISYLNGKNAFGEEQHACTGCGKCCTGCPVGAKNTLDHNYLAVAEQNGTVVLTQCEVQRIVQGAIDAAEARWTVEYTNHLTASYVNVTAKYVFLCAGAVNSPRLLHETVLRPKSEGVKQRIGLGYFPNADAVGMVYGTKDECFPSSGPCITTAAVHWEPIVERTSATDKRTHRFIMIQDGGYAPELERLLGVLQASLWTGRNRIHTTESRPKPKNGTPRQPTAMPGVALVSPLDALLDAAKGGVLQGIAPPALRQGWDAFLREVEQPILMPAIVAATIERASRARYERLPEWFKRIFSYESWLVRSLKAVFKGFIHLVGGNAEVGHHALQGLLKGSDLERDAYVRDIFGYDGRDANRRMMLLAMGDDAAPGALVFDKRRGMVADLDLYHLIPTYTTEELLMKDLTRKLGGELRLSPAWSFFGKPITVHSQGGCRMSEEPEAGVTNPHGEVHGCDGLFVMDSSVMCRSVGVNPTPSILAITECNILAFIQTARNDRWPDVAGDQTSGTAQYLEHRKGARDWVERATRAGWQLRPVQPGVEVPLESAPLGIRFREGFQGYCAPIQPGQDPFLLAQRPPAMARPRIDAAHRLLEIQGRPAHSFSLELNVTCKDLNRFFEDWTHRLELDGTLEFELPGVPHSGKPTPVTGYLELLVPRHKPYGLSPHQRRMQKHASGYEYLTRKGNPGPVSPRFMYYHLSLPDDELRLEGYKRIRNDPGMDAWRDTTALFTRFGKPEQVNGKKSPLGGAIVPCAAGVVHVNLTDFVYDELPSFETTGGEERLPRPPALEVTGTTDAARMTWAAAKFISFFFGTLQRVYSPGVLNISDALFQPVPNGVRYERPKLRV